MSTTSPSHHGSIPIPGTPPLAAWSAERSNSLSNNNNSPARLPPLGLDSHGTPTSAAFRPQTPPRQTANMNETATTTSSSRARGSSVTSSVSTPTKQLQSNHNTPVQPAAQHHEDQIHDSKESKDEYGVVDESNKLPSASPLLLMSGSRGPILFSSGAAGVPPTAAPTPQPLPSMMVELMDHRRAGSSQLPGTVNNGAPSGTITIPPQPSSMIALTVIRPHPDIPSSTSSSPPATRTLMPLSSNQPSPNANSPTTPSPSINARNNTPSPSVSTTLMPLPSTPVNLSVTPPPTRPTITLTFSGPPSLAPTPSASTAAPPLPSSTINVAASSSSSAAIPVSISTGRVSTTYINNNSNNPNEPLLLSFRSDYPPKQSTEPIRVESSTTLNDLRNEITRHLNIPIAQLSQWDIRCVPFGSDSIMLGRHVDPSKVAACPYFAFQMYAVLLLTRFHLLSLLDDMATWSS
jgi:hypothetical protein